MNSNPILTQYASTFGLPPFSAIKAFHFEPAFEVALKEHRDEVLKIAENKDAPTFENTIAMLDRAGSMKSKVSALFSNLCSSLSSDDLKVVQKKMSGPLSLHSSAVYTQPGLFDRIQSVYESREKCQPPLSAEQVRLVERVHLDFVRAGATFDDASKDKYAKIMKRLAELTTDFQQNVMTDESSWELELVEADGHLEGLASGLVAALKQCSVDRGHGDKTHYITLSRSLVEPFLKASTNRDLRRKVFNAFTGRGQMSKDRDNLKIAQEILSLRAMQAQMHGYVVATLSLLP